METSEDVLLAEGERLEDLERGGYRLIQNAEAFCFGVDAVLLADFARISSSENVLDMGTGNGVLPVLLTARGKGGAYTGIEIQPEAAALASRNAALNRMGNFRVVCGDIRSASRIFGKNAFDAVIANPPYENANRGLRNPSDAKAIARHELLCSMEDVAREAAAVLKTGGSFWLIHRPRRLAEILRLMETYRLEPKTLRMVHSFADTPAEMILVHGLRGGRPGLRCLPPLILYREPGVFTDELRTIYTADAGNAPGSRSGGPRGEEA